MKESSETGKQCFKIVWKCVKKGYGSEVDRLKLTARSQISVSLLETSEVKMWELL